MVVPNLAEAGCSEMFAGLLANFTARRLPDNAGGTSRHRVEQEKLLEALLASSALPRRFIAASNIALPCAGG